MILLHDIIDGHGFSTAIFSKATKNDIKVEGATIGDVAEKLRKYADEDLIVVTDIPAYPDAAKAVRELGNVVWIDHHPTTKANLPEGFYSDGFEMVEKMARVYEVELEMLPKEVLLIAAAGNYTDRDREAVRKWLKLLGEESLEEIARIANGLDYAVRFIGVNVESAARNPKEFIEGLKMLAPLWLAKQNEQLSVLTSKPVIGKGERVIVFEVGEGLKGVLLKVLGLVTESMDYAVAGGLIWGYDPRTKKYEVKMMAVSNWLNPDIETVDKLERALEPEAEYTFRFGAGSGLGVVFAQYGNREEFERNKDKEIRRAHEAIRSAVANSF